MINSNLNSNLQWDCDFLAIGSGAGALSAAVTAARLGLKVIVVEKDPQFGGTTAWSGGVDVDTQKPSCIKGGYC